jgi:hypothetical protein
VNEIKRTAQDIKEKFNKDIESLRKKESSRNSGNKKLLKSKTKTKKYN